MYVSTVVEVFRPNNRTQDSCEAGMEVGGMCFLLPAVCYFVFSILILPKVLQLKDKSFDISI